MKNFLILLVFIMMALLGDVTSSFGESYDPIKDNISDKYQAGAYLIYDCEDRHWVCARKQYFEECQAQRREEAESKKKDFFFSCAPIGKFPTKRSCFQRQLFMTSQNYGQRFCLTDYGKQKAVTY